MGFCEDSEILSIKNPKDFKLFRDRKAIGIRGIAYDLIISDDLRQSLITCAHKMVANNALETTPQIKFLPSLSENGVERIRRQFQDHALPEEFFDVLKLFIKSKELAMGKHIPREGFFRINSTHPDTYHSKKHPPALTFSFNREGTDYLTKNGKQVIAPAGRMIILDWDVAHKAPEINKETLKTDPRINLVL